MAPSTVSCGYGNANALPGLAQLSEAYRHAAVDSLLYVSSNSPLGVAMPTMGTVEASGVEQKDAVEEVEMGSIMWLFISFFLSCFESSEANATAGSPASLQVMPPSASSSPSSPLDSACLTLLLQQWYRECGMNMNWIHNQFRQFSPSLVAREAAIAATATEGEDEKKKAQGEDGGNAHGHLASVSSSFSKSVFSLNHVLVLLEVIVRLTLSGSMEWAAIGYDLLLQFFRHYERERSDCMYPNRKNREENHSPHHDENDEEEEDEKIPVLSAEMESCFATVKRLLLFPITEDVTTATTPHAGEEKGNLSSFSSPSRGGNRDPRGVSPGSASSSSSLPHGNLATFSSPERHAFWQREASNLIFSLKRAVGDWITTPISSFTYPHPPHHEEAEAEESDTTKTIGSSCRSKKVPPPFPPKKREEDESTTATTRRRGGGGGGGVVAFLFQQFCLTTMDLVLIMSGDVTLLEEVCVSSDLSLMGFLVGYATVIAPCHLTPQRLRRVIEAALQREVWQGILRWRPSRRMLQEWSRQWRTRQSVGEDASEAEEEIETEEEEEEEEITENPPSHDAHRHRSNNSSGMRGLPRKSASRDDHTKMVWPYLLLRRLMMCRVVSDIPFALRGALEEDAKFMRTWRWNAEVFDFKTTEEVEAIIMRRKERKEESKEEEEEKRRRGNGVFSSPGRKTYAEHGRGADDASSSRDDDDDYDDEEEEEDEASTAAAHNFHHWISSPHVREWRRRFILTAMGCFVGDLTAIPLSLSSSSSPPSIFSGVSPNVLVERYQLTDYYVHLLQGLEEMEDEEVGLEEGEEEKKDKDALFPTFSSIPISSLPRRSTPTIRIRCQFDNYSAIIWPVRLTLLLSSPLHNPQLVMEEVKRIAGSLCRPYSSSSCCSLQGSSRGNFFPEKEGSNPNSSNRPSSAAGGDLAIGFDFHQYFRLLSFIAGEEELPTALSLLPSFSSSSSSSSSGVTVFGNPAISSSSAEGVAGAGAAAVISWDIHSPLQSKYISSILHFFREEESRNRKAKADLIHPRNPNNNDEDPQNEDDEENEEYSFSQLSRCWQQSFELARQEAIRGLHGHFISEAFTAEYDHRHSHSPPPQWDSKDNNEENGGFCEAAIVFEGRPPLTGRPCLSLFLSSSSSSFLFSLSSPLLLSAWWLQHWAVVTGGGGGGGGAGGGRLSDRLVDRTMQILQKGGKGIYNQEKTIRPLLSATSSSSSLLGWGDMNNAVARPAGDEKDHFFSSYSRFGSSAVIQRFYHHLYRLVQSRTLLTQTVGGKEYVHPGGSSSGIKGRRNGEDHNNTPRSQMGGEEEEEEEKQKYHDNAPRSPSSQKGWIKIAYDLLQNEVDEVEVNVDADNSIAHEKKTQPLSQWWKLGDAIRHGFLRSHLLLPPRPSSSHLASADSGDVSCAMGSHRSGTELWKERYAALLNAFCILSVVRRRIKTLQTLTYQQQGEGEAISKKKKQMMEMKNTTTMPPSPLANPGEHAQEAAAEAISAVAAGVWDGIQEFLFLWECRGNHHQYDHNQNVAHLVEEKMDSEGRRGMMMRRMNNYPSSPSPTHHRAYLHPYSSGMTLPGDRGGGDGSIPTTTTTSHSSSSSWSSSQLLLLPPLHHRVQRTLIKWALFSLFFLKQEDENEEEDEEDALWRGKTKRRKRMEVEGWDEKTDNTRTMTGGSSSEEDGGIGILLSTKRMTTSTSSGVWRRKRNEGLALMCELFEMGFVQESLCATEDRWLGGDETMSTRDKEEEEKEENNWHSLSPSPFSAMARDHPQVGAGLPFSSFLLPSPSSSSTRALSCSSLEAFSAAVQCIRKDRKRRRRRREEEEENTGAAAAAMMGGDSLLLLLSSLEKNKKEGYRNKIGKKGKKNGEGEEDSEKDEMNSIIICPSTLMEVQKMKRSEEEKIRLLLRVQMES